MRSTALRSRTAGPSVLVPARARFRPDVEGLRAVAVVLVVLYHATGSAVPGGFVGVDVFFVISGYLITQLLARELVGSGSLSFARFYGRRARRLLPMATLVLLATTVAFAAVLSPLDRKPLVSDVRSAALYVANWHFGAQAFDYMSGADKSPVLHYWSLSVEEQFYLLWPLLLFLVIRGCRAARGRIGANARMSAALGLVAAASFAVSVIASSSHDQYAYYGLHTRAWELAIGGLLALNVGLVERVPTAARALLGWAGLGAILYSALAYDTGTVFPGTAALLPVLGAVAIIAAGGQPRPRGVGRLLSTRPSTYVGRISYSLYLWHWPCLLFAAVLTGANLGGADDATTVTAPATGWAAVAAVAVAVVLSITGHHLIEDPVRRSRWLAAVKVRSLALGAALTSCVVLSAGVIAFQVGPHADRHVVAATAAPPGSTAVLETHRLTLTETPAQARNDHPAGTGRCYPGRAGEAAPGHCQFGDPHGRRVVALIGDSHAEQWLPAFERVANRRHWQLWMWAKPSCAMIDLTVRLQVYGNNYPACARWRTNVLDRLRSLGRLDAVVVAHYSSYPDHLGTATNRPLSYSQAIAAWGHAWGQLATRLRTLTTHVVVMRDDPRAPVDVPGCIADNGHDTTPCDFARGPAFHDLNALWNAERTSSADTTDFIDLDDAICPGRTCPVISSDGAIIYRDFDHLTATFSRQLATELGPKLQRIIRKPGSA